MAHGNDLGSTAATTTATTTTPTSAKLERGARVNGSGRFIGERNGVQWIAYREADFGPMCAAFDTGDAGTRFGGDGDDEDGDDEAAIAPPARGLYIGDARIVGFRGGILWLVDDDYFFETCLAFDEDPEADLGARTMSLAPTSSFPLRVTCAASRLEGLNAAGRDTSGRIKRAMPREAEQADGLLAFRARLVAELVRDGIDPALAEGVSVWSDAYGYIDPEADPNAPSSRLQASLRFLEDDADQAARCAELNRALERVSRDVHVPVTKDVAYLRGMLEAVHARADVSSWASLAALFNIAILIDCSPNPIGGYAFRIDDEETGTELTTTSRVPGDATWTRDVLHAVATHLEARAGLRLRTHQETLRFRTMLVRGFTDPSAITDDFMSDNNASESPIDRCRATWAQSTGAAA